MAEKNTFDVNQLLEAAVRQQNAATIPPPPPPPPPVVKGLWYKSKVINLDGWIFDSCRFDDCRLIVSSPYFVIQNCFIDDSNEIEYRGAIINVVKLFNYKQSPYSSSEFHPKRNSDGTISIGV